MKNIVFIFCLLCLVACGSNSSTSVGNGAYTVSGTVKATDGTALSGATVTFTGTSSGTATTGSDGKYSFTGVNNGVYQITVAKTGYVTPASLSVTVTNADVTGKDFTATPAIYNITGSVTLGRAGLAGATITLSGTTIATITATTDANGNYSIPVVNGSYTLTAAKTGYVIFPASFAPSNVKVAGMAPTLTVTVNNADATGQNFTAMPVSYILSGTITASGVALSGATVTLSGSSTGTTTTDTNGSYSFSVPNGSYTVTPTLTGYNFTPATLSPTVNNANVTGQDFTASIPAIKPAAAEVKAAYDQVNDGVNALCSSDVNTGSTATYSYASGTLSVNVTATNGTVFPLTVVYTLTNFVSGSYTISGSTTAIVTATDYWTSTGTLTANGGDIITIVVDMARNGDPNVMTGTLTVNGYPYDYATGAYK